jgi:cytochrome b561
MLSAGGYPVVRYGKNSLPAIMRQNDSLHTLLWNAHYYLAFAFLTLVLLHVTAALFHALVRRDGVFETIAPLPLRDKAAPADTERWPSIERKANHRDRFQ